MGQGLLSALGLKPKPVTTGADRGDARGNDAFDPEVEAPVVTTAAPPVPTTAGAAPGAGSDHGVDAKGGATGAVDKDQAAFLKARAAVQKLLDSLSADPQAAKVQPAIANIAAALAAADTHAAAGEWKEIKTVLAEAQKAYAAARKVADGWADYAKHRATAMALILSYKTTPASVKKETDLVTINADGFAQQMPPDFPSALKILKKIEADKKPGIGAFVTEMTGRLKALGPANAKLKGYLQPAIDFSTPLVRQAEQNFADGEYSLCRTALIAALRVVGPAERRISRRTEFDARRAAAVKSIAAVRASPAIASHADALDARLVAADSLASVTVLKIEEGAQACVEIKARADAWVGLAKTVASAASETVLAEAGIAALDQHAAADKITAERAAIRQGLTAADAASAGASDDDPAPGWQAALAAVQRARADIAAAKKLADGFGSAVAAEAAANDPSDLAGMKKALAKLRADLQAASKGPNAAAGKAEFDRADVQAEAADTALKANDGATAAPALEAAAQALVAARTLQSEHGKFRTDLAAVEAELKMLKASKRETKIKDRIDAVEIGVADARSADQAGKGLDAIAALRIAHDAVPAAKQADAARAKFDVREAAVAKRVATTADAATKAAHQTEVIDAVQLADAFDFDGATKALQAVEVQLDRTKLDGMMTAKKPDAAEIKKLAAAMAKNGGGASVDAAIQAIPNGGSIDVLDALASGRYGIKFAIDKQSILAGADPAKAMKLVCGMFSTMPEAIVGNKSITSVTYSDAAGKNDLSAGHSYGSGAITVQGRGGLSNEVFGAAQTSKDPVTKAEVKQLPPVDPSCEPANADPIDFLSFAAAHEVGHGIDEERGFMRNHQAGADYGGWKIFGGNLQPIVDEIAGDTRFADYCKTAEQKRYVLDTLLSKETLPPPALPGSPEANAKQAFDAWYAMATSPNVYRRHGDSMSIKIGDYIYHEAYARVWVGYLAVARMKGFTGYQFRAPGEWFAELYAGFRSKKLKPDHPAMGWLTKL